MAKLDYIVHIDLNQNQLLNAALQNLATAPATSGLTPGYVYFNTTTSKAMCWGGTVWLDLSDVYTHPTFNTGNVFTPALTGAEVISQITLNNGHITSVATRTISPANIGAANASHTHNVADIGNLPAQTIVGNKNAVASSGQALTVSDVLTMLAIAYGSLTILNAGIDTTQRTWTAADISTYISNQVATIVTASNLSIQTPLNANTIVIQNSNGTGITLPAATTTTAGLLTGGDKTKLDGIQAGANNYVHPTFTVQNDFATAVTSGLQVLSQIIVNNNGHVTEVNGRTLTAADLAAVLFNNAINNGTTTTWSSSKIYEEIQDAIEQAGTGALRYIGEYNPVTNVPDITGSPAVLIGHTYVVEANGLFLGEDVESGDMIIAKENNPGNTLANWQIVNKNIPAIVPATTTVEGIIMLATEAEALAGVNNNKAITPYTLKAVIDSRIGGHTATFGNGVATNFIVNHTLGTINVLIQIYRVSDNKQVYMEVTATSNTSVTINCNTAPTNNAYRVNIIKIG